MRYFSFRRKMQFSSQNALWDNPNNLCTYTSITYNKLILTTLTASTISEGLSPSDNELQLTRIFYWLTLLRSRSLLNHQLKSFIYIKRRQIFAEILTKLVLNQCHPRKLIEVCRFSPIYFTLRTDSANCLVG